MGYMHIENLYRRKEMFLDTFHKVYALEKVHGTSAHISFNDGKVGFFSGGENYQTFINQFDTSDLLQRLNSIFHQYPTKIMVYGEAYGGKQQKMSHAYGTQPRFIVFDVAIDDKWATVPQAERLAVGLGLEFVPYEIVSCTEEALNFERDRPSRVGLRRGIEGAKAEGIVIRPMVELTDSHGNRIIAKHKRSDFSERASKRDTELDDSKAVELGNAEIVATEFVTPMRAQHVVDKMLGSLGRTLTPQDIPQFLDAMLEDVLREGKGEFEDTPAVHKAIKKNAVKLFKDLQCTRGN